MQEIMSKIQKTFAENNVHPKEAQALSYSLFLSYFDQNWENQIKPKMELLFDKLCEVEYMSARIEDWIVGDETKKKEIEDAIRKERESMGEGSQENSNE